MATTALIQGQTGGMSSSGQGGSSAITANWGQSMGVGTAMAAVSMLEGILGYRTDPAPAYLFAIELGGLLVAAFTECSGLNLEREVVDVVEGGRNAYVHKFPGRSSYSNITLKRGLSVSKVLWNWYREGLYNAKVKRINFSIILGAPMQAPGSAGPGFSDIGIPGVESVLDWGFSKIKHWNVESAWPVKWTGPSLDTSSTAVAIEAIEIAHSGIELSTEVMTPMNLGAALLGAVPETATSFASTSWAP